MRRTGFIVAALLLVTSIEPALGQTQSPPHGSGGFGGPMMSCPAAAIMPPQAGMINRMASELKLSKVQITKLKSIIGKAEKTIRPLSQSAAKSSQALRVAVLAPGYNATKISSLTAAAQRAESALMRAELSEWAQIHAVLSTTQAKRLQQAMGVSRPGPRPMGPGGFPPPPGRP